MKVRATTAETEVSAGFRHFAVDEKVIYPFVYIEYINNFHPYPGASMKNRPEVYKIDKSWDY